MSLPAVVIGAFGMLEVLEFTVLLLALAFLSLPVMHVWQRLRPTPGPPAEFETPYFFGPQDPSELS